MANDKKKKRHGADFTIPETPARIVSKPVQPAERPEPPKDKFWLCLSDFRNIRQGEIIKRSTPPGDSRYFEEIDESLVEPTPPSREVPLSPTWSMTKLGPGESASSFAGSRYVSVMAIGGRGK